MGRVLIRQQKEKTMNMRNETAVKEQCMPMFLENCRS